MPLILIAALTLAAGISAQYGDTTNSGASSPSYTVGAAPATNNYGSYAGYNSASSSSVLPSWLTRPIHYDPIINHVCTDDVNFSVIPHKRHGERHRSLHRVQCSRLAITHEKHCTRCCRTAAQPIPRVSPLVVKGMIVFMGGKAGKGGIPKCLCCAPELPPTHQYFEPSVVVQKPAVYGFQPVQVPTNSGATPALGNGY